jgi:exonuclease SbcC
LRIKTVQLENIRSHVKTTVPFAEGFNCLVGGLGCGKSSVLYAIDFAFFGDPLSRSYNYLLREGADNGKVTVQFAHSGKTYTLQRGLGKNPKGISQDKEQLKLFEEDKLIASVKNEAVAEQLKAITGLDKDLFHEVVWVRQEQLKELLNIRPRERQKKLDQLFGLSDYEVAWSGLADFQRDYKVEKGVYERDFDVVSIEKLQADHNKLIEEFSLLKDELESLKEKSIQAETAFHKASSRLQSLEDLRGQTEELGKKEAQLQANITNIEDASKRLTDEIERKKLLIEDFGKRLKSMETQERSYRDKLGEEGLKMDQTIEELREYLAVVEKQITSVGGEQEAVKKEMLTSQGRIATLKTESECPLCLQELAGDYKKSLLERLREKDVEGGRKLAELQKNFDELERLRSIVNLSVMNLQLLAPQIGDLKNRIVEEQESLNSLSTELDEKQREEKAFRDQLNVARSEIVKFDISELETARKLRDEAFTQYSNVKHELETAESRKKDMLSRMDEFKERLDRAEQKVERMKKVEMLLGVIENMRGAYRSIQPRLRSELVTYLRRMVQQVLGKLVGETGPLLTVNIDETYSPIVRSEEGFEREVSNLSGGERTLLAFAYRLGLGQLIMQSRTGHGLYMLLLDEPTESLGREDGSVDRLAESISRLKAIEQIIAVTHSDVFAEKAEHVIRVDKEADVSKVSVEK